MFNISIDTNKCKKDGLCTLACPRSIFRRDDQNSIPDIVDVKGCMGCGACISVCPAGAINHSGYPDGTVKQIKTEEVPSYDQILELFRSRRSRRAFREKAVSKTDIEKIIEATRFAPSEHNVQDTEIIVVQNEEIINQIGKTTCEYYIKFTKMIENPIGKVMFRVMQGKRVSEAVINFIPEMKGVADLYQDGKDYILCHAPLLILFCADSVGGFPDINANFACMNAILAAESMGMGCFFAGFVTRACRRTKKIGKLVNLPETHNIYGIIALGYPKVKFRKWPERKPASVVWV